jgi:hypothetical protein
MHHGEQPAQVDADVAEVHLGLSAQGMTLGNSNIDERLALASSHFGHIAAHRRLADLGPVLVDQTLPDPTSGVALLARRAPISLQPGLDDRLVGPQRRRRSRW